MAKRSDHLLGSERIVEMLERRLADARVRYGEALRASTVRAVRVAGELEALLSAVAAAKRIAREERKRVFARGSKR